MTSAQVACSSTSIGSSKCATVLSGASLAPISASKVHSPARNRRQALVVRASEASDEASTAATKAREEEKFAVVDTGKWECRSCGYVYDQFKGDPNYPIAPGVELSKLPDDWLCPTCGAAPDTFNSLSRELAGFAQNQSYGFGTNSMTGDQKGLLIWGSMVAALFVFLSGYLME
eukprot:TRINITY_DN6027_c0_g2_i1.p1 TRINITY_DN6027_c0_g2~~TRINITY_DN6027_c0_g2_i1.p1  ORF type:complete len:203 (+),score=8.47 TRINITY_DN6027_c0_g2_i1:90-611(+)